MIWNPKAFSVTILVQPPIGAADRDDDYLSSNLTSAPGYIREKDIPFVVMVLLEVVALAVSVSGILGAGGPRLHVP